MMGGRWWSQPAPLPHTAQRLKQPQQMAQLQQGRPPQHPPPPTHTSIWCIQLR